MAKKSKEKKLRRELEVLKAQVKVQKSPEHEQKSIKDEKSDEDRFILPIKQIRRDVLKTFLFALISTGILIVLNLTNTSYDMLIKALSRLQ